MTGVNHTTKICNLSSFHLHDKLFDLLQNRGMPSETNYFIYCSISGKVTILECTWLSALPVPTKPDDCPHCCGSSKVNVLGTCDLSWKCSGGYV